MALDALKHEETIFTLDYVKSIQLQEDQHFEMRDNKTGKTYDISTLFNDGDKSRHGPNS